MIEVVGSIPTGAIFYFALLCQCWQDSARTYQKIMNEAAKVLAAVLLNE